MARPSPHGPTPQPLLRSALAFLFLLGTALAAPSPLAWGSAAVPAATGSVFASAAHDDAAGHEAADHDHDHDAAEDDHDADGHDHDADAHDHDADAHDHDAAAHDHEADAHDHADHDHGTEGVAALVGVRVLVTAADAPEARVLDAATGSEVGRFTLPGPARVWPLPGGRMAVLAHPGADRVSVVDAGFVVIDHGDHQDLVLGSPYVVQTVRYGLDPDAVAAAGDAVAVRHAGDGSVVRFDARLIGVSLDHAFVAGDAAGAGGVAFADDHLIVATAATGSVRVVAPSGAEVVRFDGCPDAAQVAAAGSRAVVACADGALVVAASPGGVWTARKLPYPPGGPVGARWDGLRADAAAERVGGTFADGVAVLDVRSATWTRWVAPAAPLAVRWDDDGHRVHVLSADGVLRTLQLEEAATATGVRVTDAVPVGAAAPVFEVLAGHGFVADPARGALVVVRLADLAVVLEAPLDVVPASLALLAVPAAVVH